jgi:DNA adenine methylase
MLNSVSTAKSFRRQGQTSQIKPLAPYYGGKSCALAAWILGFIPEEHQVYVEPYFGMGSVLLNKKPCTVEVANDLNDGVVTLFRVVRELSSREELIRRLELTPYARSEFRDCATSWKTTEDPIEKARRVYVTLAQGFNGVLGGNWSWSCGSANFGNPKTDFAVSFKNSFEKFPVIADRLKYVIIENQDALKIMRRWDSPNTLFYLDPPYPHETREPGSRAKLRKKHYKPRHYTSEMTTEQHTALLDYLTSPDCTSMVLLSSYPNELYEQRLGAAGAGWRCETMKTRAQTAMKYIGYGSKANPASADRTEVLWINPRVTERKDKPKAQQLSLL